MKAKLLCGFLLALLCAPAFAQDMMAPIPGEMKELDYLVGTWEGEMNMNGMKMKAGFKAEKILGGRYIREMHTYTMGDNMQMTGMFLMTYDEKQKNWLSYWFDQSEAGNMEMRGGMEGGKYVAESKPMEMMDMKNVVMRATWTKVSDTKCTMSLDMKNGDKWDQMMEATYNKKG
ncbi:MAG: DUF1579 family protein [Armatimonadetes bacterium]|nr:DUF1579 family protein [Armatimonadota bacterium]